MKIGYFLSYAKQKTSFFSLDQQARPVLNHITKEVSIFVIFVANIEKVRYVILKF